MPPLQNCNTLGEHLKNANHKPYATRIQNSHSKCTSTQLRVKKHPLGTSSWNPSSGVPRHWAITFAFHPNLQVQHPWYPFWQIGRNMGVSKNWGIPKWMVKIMENPIKIDDLGVPLFLITSIWICRICGSTFLQQNSSGVFFCSFDGLRNATILVLYINLDHPNLRKSWRMLQTLLNVQKSMSHHS